MTDTVETRTGIETRRLSRTAYAVTRGCEASAAPVRIVHIGLGAFARAHQAWYTAEVDGKREWGISAFTGRTGFIADLLTPQDGLFTLVERGPDTDEVGVVTSVVEVLDGDRVNELEDRIAAEETAIVTMTVTEAGYRLRSDGSLDLSDPTLAGDLRALRAGGDGSAPASALGRLVCGLAKRRNAGSGPIAVVPCDNIPDNGSFLRTGTLAFADALDAELAEWIAVNVSFVSTSVDRITPRITDEDVRKIQKRTGWEDASPVITEPYSSWILCGDFPAGRPAWEEAGAVFTDDIKPFERRKLWLLNGAHSLLAHAGQLRGHKTVAAAMADPYCVRAVDGLWDEACQHLPSHLDLAAYRSALAERFANGRIAHHLEQIEAESLTKLRVRIAPVALAERRSGRDAAACALALAAWVRRILAGQQMIDARSVDIQTARSAADECAALITLIDSELGADSAFVERVREAVGSLSIENATGRHE